MANEFPDKTHSQIKEIRDSEQKKFEVKFFNIFIFYVYIYIYIYILYLYLYLYFIFYI